MYNIYNNINTTTKMLNFYSITVYGFWEIYKTMRCGSILRSRDVMLGHGQVALELILIFSSQYILCVANGGESLIY